MITAEIDDPTVITNSVKLLYIPASGSPVVIGSLNDDGLNGDAAADDNVFTIIPSFASYPIGTMNLAISASFTGLAQPVQCTLSCH